MPRCKESKENDQNGTNLPTCGRHSYTATEAKELRSSLLSWYDSSARQLPWRSAAQPGHPAYIADPDTRGYSTLVSEVMLQQTQVATVVAYYTRWMARWPTVHSLAAASLEEVQEAWSGLGYYSRGRRLREAAISVVEQHTGQLPRTALGLASLPGVGRYTAAAVASIAYGEVTGLVDGNVVRVLARLRRIGAAVEARETVEALWSLAGDLVDRDRPGDFNQAAMELGATVCSPRDPACSACPVRGLCGARAAGEDTTEDVEECGLCGPREGREGGGVTAWPRKKKKKESRVETSLVAVVRRAGGWALVRRPPTGLLANLLEFPSLLLGREESREAGVQGLEAKLERLGVGVAGGLQLVGELQHLFSHINMTYLVYSGEVVKAEGKAEDVDWMTSAEFASCGTSTAMRKVFKLATDPTSPGSRKRKRLEDPKQKSISSFFAKK